MSKIPRRPHRTPLVVASVAVHLLAALGLVARPDLWALVAALLVFNHAILMGFGLWPRSRALGPNLTHLAEHTSPLEGVVALTFDDGPEPEGTTQVLDLLKQSGHTATFFLIGERAQRYPEIIDRIVNEGHELANHTQTHPYWFCTFPPGRIGREVRACQEALARWPRSPWFRAPAGFRNVFLERILARDGLELVTWTRRGFDTAHDDPDQVLGDLARDLAAGDILLLHDAGSATTSSGAPVALEVLPRLLETLEQQGLRSVTLSEALDRSTAGRV